VPERERADGGLSAAKRPQRFGVDNANIAKPVVGLYALDLSDENKGKALEPVRVSLTPDKTAVIVDQFTRGLPPTKVPAGGGTVSFDDRFAENVTCPAFNME
jgi:hypothetical protein